MSKSGITREQMNLIGGNYTSDIEMNRESGKRLYYISAFEYLAWLFSWGTSAILVNMGLKGGAFDFAPNYLYAFAGLNFLIGCNFFMQAKLDKKKAIDMVKENDGSIEDGYIKQFMDKIKNYVPKKDY